MSNTELKRTRKLAAELRVRRRTTQTHRGCPLDYWVMGVAS